MTKNLSYFMREQKEEIVKAPAPKGLTDENGNPLELEIRVLSNEQIRKIQDGYRKRTIALDKNGNPYISNGEVVFQTEYDGSRALRHIMAEALVYPNLKDKELMDFYKCYDISEMPYKVFFDPAEYNHVFRMVMTALGMMSDNTEGKENPVEEAKN